MKVKEYFIVSKAFENSECKFWFRVHIADEDLEKAKQVYFIEPVKPDNPNKPIKKIRS